MDLKKYNYIQTSPNSKINNDDYKNRFNLFNYRLFNVNEENKKLNINKLSHKIGKELSLDLIINNKYRNRIKVKNKLIDNTQNNNNKNNNNCFYKSLNYFNNNIIQKSYKSHKKNNITTTRIISSFKRIKNNNNATNMNICLIPFLYISKNKKKIKKQKLNYLKENFPIQKNLNKNKNKILNNLFFENKRRNETEENDMKPKYRFINIKKELLEETTKINKMFISFGKQIKQIEKEIKFRKKDELMH